MIDKDATHITAILHYDDIDLNLYYLGWNELLTATSYVRRTCNSIDFNPPT